MGLEGGRGINSDLSRWKKNLGKAGKSIAQEVVISFLKLNSVYMAQLVLNWVV